MADSWCQRSHSRFTYEKDFCTLLRDDKLYALDATYKVVHILKLREAMGIATEAVGP
jgi:hypothetical protein